MQMALVKLKINLVMFLCCDFFNLIFLFYKIDDETFYQGLQ